jgi:hypothetical protein
MKNLARGSIVLIMVALFLGMNNFTTIAEPALAIAIDSQKELQQNRQDKQNKHKKNQTIKILLTRITQKLLRSKLTIYQNQKPPR